MLRSTTNCNFPCPHVGAWSYGIRPLPAHMPGKRSSIILYDIQLPVFHLTAGLLAIKSTTWLQIFHRTKVIASDLQNCCSNEDSSTVPWLFVSLSINYV